MCVYIYISVSLQSNLQLCSRNAWKVSAVCGCRASSTGSKRWFQRSADKRSPCSLVAWWGERLTFKPWLVGQVGLVFWATYFGAESFRSRRWEVHHQKSVVSVGHHPQYLRLDLPAFRNHRNLVSPKKTNALPVPGLRDNASLIQNIVFLCIFRIGSFKKWRVYGYDNCTTQIYPQLFHVSNGFTFFSNFKWDDLGPWLNQRLTCRLEVLRLKLDIEGSAAWTIWDPLGERSDPWRVNVAIGKKTPRNMERYGNIIGISREYNQDIWEMELLVCWKKNIEVLLMFQANRRYPFLTEYLFRGSANLVTG